VTRVRPACLIVNPSAGGGRAAERLPAVEAALRARGVGFRVERTTGLEHARALARETIDRGELAVAMGGDGLTGALAGELRGATACSGSSRAAGATTSRASWGFPRTPKAPATSS
jgi:diacylglycerol kinase family enzyme